MKPFKRVVAILITLSFFQDVGAHFFVGAHRAWWDAYFTYKAWAATTRYVSPSGSGSTCSEEVPCSYATGFAATIGGDTLYLKPGTYTNIISTPPSGISVSQPTVIAGAPGAVAIIRPVGFGVLVSVGAARSNITFRNLVADCAVGNSGNCRGFQTAAGTVITGLVVEDYEVKNYKNDGFFIGAGTTGIFRRIHVHDGINGGTSPSNAMYFQGRNSLIEHVELGPNIVDAFSLRSDIGGFGNTFRYIKAHGSTQGTTAGRSINIQSMGTSAAQANIFHNWEIYDMNWNALRIQGNHTRLFNTSIYDITGWGITAEGSNIQLINNIIWSVSGQPIINTGPSTTQTNNTTTDPSFVNPGAGNFNVPSGQASNGSDLSAQGVQHNLTPGRGSRDPMERASASTLDVNTVRTVLHNSFGALRNATTVTGWSCKFDGGSAVVPASAAPAGNTAIDLTFSGTPMDETTVVTCSYSSTTGSLLNTMNIGNKTDATGNAHLLSFTDQPVTNTLTGGGGGGEEDPPATATVGHSTETSDTTTHNFTVPLSIASGDLLIAHLSINGLATVSGFTGFTQLCRATSVNVAGEIWYRIADGAETDGTYTTSASEQSITRIYRIPVAVWHGTTPPECNTAAGTSNTPNPPSLSPSWAGAENLRWMAFFSRQRGQDPVTAYPASYPDDQFTDSTGDTTPTVSMAVASRALNTATEDPGPFTTGGGSGNWSAFTAAIRAVGEGGGGGGEPAAVWEQRDYCWKDWQDAETVPCSFAQNTPAISHGNGRIVARIGLGITADDPEGSAHVGEYRINGGAWASISASGCTAPCVHYAAPKARANGEATTRLLTLPGGLTFAAGALQAQAGASGVFDFAEDAWVEFDQSIQLVGLTPGDVLEIRMRKEVGALYDSYTNYPTLNVVVPRASAS